MTHSLHSRAHFLGYRHLLNNLNIPHAVAREANEDCSQTRALITYILVLVAEGRLGGWWGPRLAQGIQGAIKEPARRLTAVL